jgi:GH25 family lysozyme M1 (1,4-beta-N-acetylmuramidase)
MAGRRAHGVDISEWQGIFNPPDEIKDEIDFVVLKASQNKYRDPKFENFYSTAMNFPIRGAYHYYVTSNTETSKLLPESAVKKREIKQSKVVQVVDNGKARKVPEVLIKTIPRKGAGWKEQADFFIETVNGKDFHFFALDVELGHDPKKKIGQTKNIFSEADVENIEQWINYVKTATGIPVMLYTRVLILKKKLIPKGGENLKNMNLWIAWYSDDVSREDDNPYKKYSISGVSNWHLWQYSADKNGKGSVYGVKSSGIDLDVFNGTVEQMKAWLAGEAIEPTISITAEPEVAARIEKPMEWINAQLDKIIAAGILPSVQININSSDFEIEKLINLMEMLEKDGITPEVELTLGISSSAETTSTITSKETAETNLGIPLDQDVPTPTSEKNIKVRAFSKKKSHIALYAFKNKDDVGKPDMVKTKPVMRIPNGKEFSVSATHKVSKKDKGNGKITASGGEVYYYITDYPGDNGEVGNYVLKSNVKRV